MKQVLCNLSGDPNVGLYAFCTDKYLLVSHRLDEKKIQILEETLGLKAHQTTILGIDLLGIFLAGNSNGIIVSDEADEDEIEAIRKTGVNVCVLKGKYTALGNLIVANDNGAFISELLESAKERIAEALQVPVEVGMIAGHEIVGSFAVTTNEGCLIHPNTSESTAKIIEDVLKVKVDVGTVNFGSPFVAAGLLANKNGLVIGDMTSGPEITRILETLYK